MQADEDALFAEALARCANEPIHLVGSIQTHGVLVGIDSAQMVRIASRNCEQYFKCGMSDILGQSIASLLGDAQADRLRDLKSDRSQYSELCHVKCGHTSETRLIEVHAYRSDGLLLLEIENAITSSVDEMQGVFPMLQESLRSIYDHSTIATLSDYIAQQIRTLIQFDRVMIYRFDHQWNGDVIAESCSAELNSFLGHHFPASDIPPQARALYAINQIRFLFDTEEPAVMLEPSLNLLTGKPLDMSMSGLRSMSPVHVAYMRNMGVRVSLSISLMVKGKLWGMVCCHNKVPQKVSLRMRELLEVIGRIMSSQLGVLEDVANTAVMRGVRETLVQLTHMIDESEDIGSLITLMETQVLKLVNATGAVIVIGKDRYVFGRTPSTDEVDELSRWIKRQPLPDAAFFTDALQEQYPKAST